MDGASEALRDILILQAPVRIGAANQASYSKRRARFRFQVQTLNFR